MPLLWSLRKNRDVWTIKIPLLQSPPRGSANSFCNLIIDHIGISLNSEIENMPFRANPMWGGLSSLPIHRTFQSGLWATGKSPKLADKNVCPT